MNRRTLLWSLAFAAGGGALWRYRDWLPERGLLNPCRAPQLPNEIADHPAILRATRDLDLSKVWDCHVHLVGTGDSEPDDVWVNPALDSIRHPLQLVQKRLYMNASCVSDHQDGDAAYVDRLQTRMTPLSSGNLSAKGSGRHRRWRAIIFSRQVESIFPSTGNLASQSPLGGKRKSRSPC